MMIIILLMATALEQAQGKPPSDAAEARCEAPRNPPSLANYVCASDYPVEALRHHEEGTVGFHLDISVEGLVTACQVTESSGSAALDQRTCKLMSTRIRFTPTRDAQGNAIP